MNSLYPILAILLLWIAAYTDVTERIIRNWVSIGLLTLFCVYAAFNLNSLNLPGHLVWAIATFALFFTGFAVGKVGGGDVKLATMVMLWAGPETGLQFLLVMALSGGILALFIISPITSFFLQWVSLRLGRSGTLLGSAAYPFSVPYGAAIAIGGTVSLYSGYLGGF
ncbi:prepilin peptidase [Sneathiella sp.]|uniref:A24 family peptidase n=1 Tax=Sneathiella sp. TaxID=1964365 RepID=UPI00356A2C6C